jgi:clan AA aspartic protease
MIGYVVEGLEVIVPIRVLDVNGEPAEVDFVMDTGSTAQLTLPPEAIEILGLEPLKRVPATLADGTVIECNVYSARVIWQNELRAVEVTELDRDALLGMRLMASCRVTFDVLDGGHVEVTELTKTDD